MADDEDKRDKESGQFQPGNKYGHGRKGARNRLHADYITDLLNHFNMTGADIARDGLTRGQAAIDILYKESPREYLKLIASVLPKELIHEDGRLESMSDEEIAEYLDYIRRFKTQVGEAGKDREGVDRGSKPALN